MFQISQIQTAIALYSLLHFVLCSAIRTCPSDEMVFHPPTHTCIFVSNHRALWEKARNTCRSLLGGVNRDQPGYLGMVLEKDTNAFLKEMIPKDGGVWLGLTYIPDQKTFSWLGPGISQQVSGDYFDWVPGEPLLHQDTSNHYHVILNEDGWHQADGKAGPEYFLCQVPAVVPSVNMELIPALERGTPFTGNVSCSFANADWDQIQWKVMSQDNMVASCVQRRYGDKLRRMCAAMDVSSGFSAVINVGEGGVVESRLSVPGVALNVDTMFSCVFYKGDEIVAQATKTVLVYESVQGIDCKQRMNARSVEVRCRTPQVFPRATCLWQIFDSNGYQFPLNNTVSMITTHEPFVSDEKMKYSVTSCHLLMEYGSFPFQAGHMNVSITMHPDLQDKGLPSNFTPAMTQYVGVDIEEPMQPTFQFLQGKTPTKGSKIKVVRLGQVVTLSCDVKHGLPGVFLTSLKCTMAINSNGSKTAREEMGLPVGMTTTVTRDMRGNMCECTGSHLTNADLRSEVWFQVVEDRPPSPVVAGVVGGVDNDSNDDDIGTVTGRNNDKKDITIITTSDIDNEDIITITTSDIDNKDITTITTSDIDNEDITTITTSNIDNKNITTITTSDNDNKDITTITTSDIDNKDITTIRNSNIDNKDITTITPSDIDNKDITTITTSDIDNKYITTITTSNNDNKDITTITNSDIDNKDITTIMNSNNDNKDITTITNSDIDNKDITTITNSNNDNKYITTITNSNNDNKDITTITNSDIDNKDITTITNSNNDNKDITTITNSDIDNKDITTITNNNSDNKDITTITNNNIDNKDITTITNSKKGNDNKGSGSLDKDLVQQGCDDSQPGCDVNEEPLDDCVDSKNGCNVGLTSGFSTEEKEDTKLMWVGVGTAGVVGVCVLLGSLILAIRSRQRRMEGSIEEGGRWTYTPKKG